MKIVIFGLTISSSWGNGHATTWRGLLRELIGRGHKIVFYERDVPYYAAHRDLHELPGGRLELYGAWADVLPIAQRDLADAGVAIVTSYCPDAIAATELVCASNALRVFYDMDTPVTLARLRSGGAIDYIPRRGLRDFDLALSFTGGGALTALEQELGAPEAVPLYGSVDPQLHHPVAPMERYRCALSYLGTYAGDRQPALDAFFIAPAMRLPYERFLLAGAQYPADFNWKPNIDFVPHLAPAEHSYFYCSSRLTLNVTRAAMREMGWCPSGRLFEAASCGAPLISDHWQGIEDFLTPGEEILIVNNAKEAIAAMQLSDAELQRVAGAARERTLTENTAAARAAQLEKVLGSARSARAAAGGLPEAIPRGRADHTAQKSRRTMAMEPPARCASQNEAVV
jgi:spore maturation protein CgeB